MPPRGDDFGPTPQLSLPRLTPAVKVMLIAIVALYVLQLVEQQWLHKGWFATWVALYPRLVLRGFQLWRLLSWPLVQAIDVSGVLWACAGLYFFGTDLEQSLGTRRFLFFTTLAVVGTGIVASLYGLLHPAFYTLPVYGVMPLGFALTAAWGVRFPEKRLLFPPVSARVFVWIILGVAVLSVLARSQHESPAASLGAIGIGWLLGRYWRRIEAVLDRSGGSGRGKSPAKGGGLRVIAGGKVDDRRKPVDKRFLN